MMSNVASALSEIDRTVRSDQVVTDPDVCASYAHDESETPPRTPDAVIRARCQAEVVAVTREWALGLEVVTADGAPLCSAGGRSKE